MHKVTNNDEFGSLICQWFDTIFHKEIKPTKTSLLEILTDLIYSTKENRYGPMPPPEYQVVVRETIRKSIELNLPIPVLVPWGGRKAKITESNRLDFAEVSGLQQLIHLDNCIRNYFSPGLNINIRVEDINANFLYRHEDNVADYTEKYSTDFSTLIRILAGTSHKIMPVRESSLMSHRTYFTTATQISPLIQEVLMIRVNNPFTDITKTEAFFRLQNIGWKGTFPNEQIEYYIQRYSNLYPGKNQEEYIAKMADYFAGSKARYELGGKGNPESEVGSFIQLNFSTPVPGAPDELFSNTVYWRTLPLSSARTHIAPWRAKGFLKICGNQVKNKITSFNDPVVSELSHSETIISSHYSAIAVDSDYLLEQ